MFTRDSHRPSANPHSLPTAILSFCLLPCSALAAEPAPPPTTPYDETIEKAFNPAGGKYGKFSLDLRWRYEYVDQDNVNAAGRVTTPDTANASTLRARFGYLTPQFSGLQAFAEFEGLQDVGANDYNDNPAGNGNGKTRFPVIADPAESEVNQLWVGYSGLPATQVKIGRQRIVFDNHRFVGDVIWRQMQQTYDAATVTSTYIPRTSITAGYLIGIQDIYSRHVELDAPILNASFDTGYGKLIGYGLWLDYKNPTESRNLTYSSKTYGVRFDGGTPVVDNLKALYTLEYAHQQNYESNPIQYEADYWLADVGVNLYGVTLRGAMEELGASNGIGFSTPLATLHAFQGWADLFLITPPNGIRDLYGVVKYTVLGIDLAAVYHDFSAPDTGLSYGHEIDLLAEKKFGKHYSVLLKFADYDGDRDANRPGHNILDKADTQKFWLQGSVSF
ncbi:alginate export family protein [Methylococcus sp. EFPC2]|uniref:alginate export family protein n=1 Tax=Methylococcus sp. EFPC2 TaxID=2812648 RepID=UPI0019680C48|nr:alginate export family protein [Methylococcus sp. EFPC2]QSA97648.1 alginate export family protein [Methylococcus sp. EFPC2]